ncbi:MAG: rhombosortase [Opitutaceae bacterium]|nr:rhombosortase [Opitutaceae bacterium]
MKSFPYLIAMTAVASVALWLQHWLTSVFEFSRAGISNGEVWRLVTGHLCHFSPSHLLWDVLLFIALGTWVERRSRRAWLAVVGIGALAVSLAVWWLAPELQRYRGLSGLDSALFAWIAFDLTRFGWKARRWSATGLGGGALIGLLGKSCYEGVTGSLLFVDPGQQFVPVPLAHGVGALVGIGVCLATPLLSARRSEQHSL